MEAEFNGKYHLDLLNDQSLWTQAPIEPKTPTESSQKRQGFSRPLSVFGRALAKVKRMISCGLVGRLSGAVKR